MKKRSKTTHRARRRIALDGIPPLAPRPSRAIDAHSIGLKRITRIEYYVAWQREGLEPKSKKFASRKRATDRIGIMTSDEPWRYFGTPFDRGRDGDEETETTINGEYITTTLIEEAELRRASLPPLEWIEMHRRFVTRTEWMPVDDMDLIPERYRRRK